jgi:hypothetical protein
MSYKRSNRGSLGDILSWATMLLLILIFQKIIFGPVYGPSDDDNTMRTKN